MTNQSKAILFMSISALSFAAMAMAVRLSGDVPIVEKVFFRNLISVIIAFYMIKKTSGKVIGKFFSSKKNIKWLVLRSTFGLIGVALYFYSIDNLDLADSAMLNRISPFFVTIFAAIFIGEKFKKIQIPALIVVFLASLMIIKPSFDISILPALSGLLSAVFAGAAYTTLRFLHNKEKPASIVFFFSMFSVVSLFPFLLFDFVMPDSTQMLFLLLTGIFAAGGQFGLTYAYRYGPAGEVSLYSYLNVVFNAMFGFLIWNEIPDAFSVIGAIIIVVVSVYLFLQNRKTSDN